MVIERLRWWHIADLLPIEADLFGAEQWSAAMFWGELAQGHYYRVAVAGTPGDQQVIGYAGLAVPARDEAWIQNIAVRRDRQGTGVGKTLLAEMLAEATRRGVEQVWLEVAVDNEAACGMYTRYGFTPVTVRRGYYQPSNTDAVVMVCTAPFEARVEASSS